ncbi:MAG: Nicotinamide-nucleotide amidohydrolase PncC [Syntrophus sp. SKADARSKE-3]|nr:Nicotinamide-nucleotide amidohydrolase PncC [Syntrophus sp. SKADARSKE-3]
MKVAILTIGNELISGRTQDANTAFIARTCHFRGWPVVAALSVGDNDADIKEALTFTLARADAVIVTGGLGPTADDITTAAIARAFGLSLYTDEAVLAALKGMFAQFRFTWTENNAKQAAFPDGAEVLPNPVGTAAGFALRRDGRVIIVMPGVPREVNRMWPERAVPLLTAAFPDTVAHVVTRTIKTFGLSEASVDEKLSDVDFTGAGVAVGFYPNFPENHIVLTVRNDGEAEAQKTLAWAQGEVEKRFHEYIFAYDSDTLEGIIARLLTEKGLTLAVAESCTGGMVTDRITDVPGSSVFLERGLVTYSNAAKTDLLDVPATIIEKYGAVSEQTARLMAEGVRKRAGTDLGLSTTGIAGPGGGSEEKPVGTVFMALADSSRTICRKYAYRWDRRRNKIITTQAALLLLKRHLTGEDIHD